MWDSTTVRSHQSFCIRARLQSCRKSAKKDRASAPEYQPPPHSCIFTSPSAFAAEGGAGRCGARQIINKRNLMHAAHRAVRRAALLRQKLPLQIRLRVLRQRHPRIPALLRAVMHQPVLADVQEPRPRAAPPVIRLAVRNVLLEVIEPRIILLLPRAHFRPDPALVRRPAASAARCRRG